MNAAKTDYWLKQTPGQPLFPDLLWSRPENKTHAGKLLIIGGNSFGFSGVGIPAAHMNSDHCPVTEPLHDIY